MDTKKTITSIFMIPLLKINKDSLREMGFINAYIGDNNIDVSYENAIHLLFKPKSLSSFRTFLQEEYDRTTNIIDDYDYGGGFVVVVYKLNSKFINDINLIKKGLYSKTSKVFQKEFPKSVKILTESGLKEEISLQFRIFNKTKDMVDYWEEKLDVHFTDDQEVWYSFDIEKETLSMNILKEQL